MIPGSLRKAVERFRRDREGRLRWIEPELGYPGKIVNLRLGDAGFAFIATPDDGRVEEGECPAPDATLLLRDGRDWDRLAGGALSLRDALRTHRARVWGNLNDVQALLSIVAGKE